MKGPRPGARPCVAPGLRGFFGARCGPKVGALGCLRAERRGRVRAIHGTAKPDHSIGVFGLVFLQRAPANCY